ncbi:cell division cycle protein 16 homolog [Planococcus citri]|uniref:cell division cycle protein 16 homolog n=1 Tax=Planococcus citri TaxID=170843 RepID=UPI0031FA1B3C
MAGNSDIEMQVSSEGNIDKCRQLAKKHFDLDLYSTALFWADKVSSLSNNEPRDVYFQARCVYAMKQYRRAILLVQNMGLDKTDIYCRYIVIKCLIEVKEYSEALSMLMNEDVADKKHSTTSRTFNNLDQDSLHNLFNVPEEECGSLRSALLTLKGQVYEALDNRNLATDCYKEALRNNINCFEALNALLQHGLLTSLEAQNLLESFTSQENNDSVEDVITKPLYQTLLKSYIGDSLLPPDVSITLVPALETNPDVLASEAERLYYNCSYKECIELTEMVLKKDRYHTGCLMTHIACSVELGYSNKLFYLAHELVDVHPEAAISWLAVGCYYYLIGKHDSARRYLSKATLVDNMFGAAWLAYGHSFAADNEHDQAMAAYFKASQLMKGCYLPLLYIGLECGLTSNTVLANRYFQEARLLAPKDPFVMHEMGVIAYQNHRFDKAEHYFLETLNRLKEIKEPLLANKWEPLFNNLGHVSRKLKKHDKALEYHQQALLFSPLNASTLTSIGLVHSLCGNISEAVEALHKSLGLRRNDSFTTTLLNYVIEQLVDHEEPFEGSELVESIKITSEEHKPKFKKTAWTQNPESSVVSFEENDPMNNDNDQNYSALSIDTDM